MNPNPVNGATILTLGILSLVLCLPLGPIAWAMSNNALNVLDVYEPKANDYSQRGMVVAGRVCAIIGTVFFGLALLVLLARGCANSRASSLPGNESDRTTVTIDGRPASPSEKEMFLRQIQAIPPGTPTPPAK